MPLNFAQTEEGLVIIANGIDPVLTFDSYQNVAANAGLAYPTTAVTAGGSGVGTLNGSYFAYVSFLRSDGFESSMSPSSGNFILTNNGQVDYSSVPISPDSRVTARRIYRNTDGQARTVYLDVEIPNNVDTTATSTLSDTILQAGLAFPLFDDQDLSQLHNNDMPPDTKPFVAWHLNRCYYYGAEDYAEGSCEVVQGSFTVTGRNTIWKSNWVGRLIYVAGGNATYEIGSVDEILQTITLTESYTGTTNLFAGYTVRPTPGEASLMYFSQDGSAEKVNPVDAVSVPESDDQGTGLLAITSFLYILKRKSVYRWSCQASPRTDGRMFSGTKRGCVNQRCAVVANDIAYMLDERGVWKYGGSQESADVSQQIQDMFRDGTDTPINWTAARYFHASHSPGESTIRWFVCFHGDFRPRHALCYCYTREAWWTEENGRPIGASVLGSAGHRASTWGNGIEQVYLGSDASEVFGLCQSTPDLIASPTSISTLVTASGIQTVTGDQSLPTGLVGCPAVLRPQGAGSLQQRRIIAASGQQVTVHPPWLVCPTVGDEIIYGGFGYQMRTQSFRYARGEANSERGVEVAFDRNPGSKLDLEVIHDSDGLMTSAASISYAANFGVEFQVDRAAARIDMGKRGPYGMERFDGLRETMQDGRRDVTLLLTGVGGLKKDAINAILIKGVAT